MGSTGFGFTGTNAAAARVAARSAARLVTEIARETMLAIRDVIVQAIIEGNPPAAAARSIRSMVGLNRQQARAAEAYRQELIDSGLSADRIERDMDRYVAKAIRERSRTIARTEVMQALNEGARETYRQAQREGLLTDAAVKEWLTTDDEKACPICEPLDGVQVPLGDDFETENGPLPGPPAHPRCRCAMAVTEPAA